jgi:hypothetical protein
MDMAEAAKDKLRRVTALANRLRLVQIDFGGENAELRRKFLSDEIEQALSAVVPGERPAFLEELMTRFPTWDPNVELMSPEKEMESFSSTGELESPISLADRLVGLVPTLSNEEKQALIKQLREAGLAPQVRQDWPDEAVQALSSALQLSSQESIDPKSIDPSRLLEMAALLVEFAQRLDQFVWDAWKGMAPPSTVRRPARLPGTLRRFLGGDPDVPGGRVKEDLDKLRSLLYSLISSVARAASQFATDLRKKLSPEAVIAEVEDKHKEDLKGLLGMKAGTKQYWLQYQDMFKEITDDDYLVKQLKNALARSTEALLKSGSR